MDEKITHFLKKMLYSQTIARQRMKSGSITVNALINNRIEDVTKDFITDSSQWIKELEELLYS